VKLWLTDVARIGFKSSLMMAVLLVMSLVFTNTVLAVLTPLATLITSIQF
jgi:hypothetical protein